MPSENDKPQVRVLDAARTSAWDSFVRHHPEGTFYHLSGWRQIIEDHLGHESHYLYVECRGQITGVLPLARVKSRLFGDALISVPFLVYGGPVSDDEVSQQVLVDHAKRLADGLGVDYLELRNVRTVTDWPAKDNYVTFRREIDQDVDANLKAIPRKQRAVIRKAIKGGLDCEMDSNVDRLFETLSECKRNLGTPFFGRSYLAAIKSQFGDECEIDIVTHSGRLVAGVMSFRFRDEILPYYGGGGSEARKFGANDYMYWKVMERACQDGVRIFDFGRSRMGTGSYNFKRHWGFDMQPLSYEFHLVKAASVPQVDPTNKRYERLVSTWSKLPLPVAKMLGPPVARLLG